MTAPSNKDGGKMRRWLTAAWIAAAALILVAPFIAMQMKVEGVNWSLQDFAFAGALLVGAGLGYELATWKTTSLAKRLLIASVIAAVVIVIWVEAAVGIFPLRLARRARGLKHS